MDVEAVRQKFRPSIITTLFVGESAPISGDFFYKGNTNLLRYMKQAVETSLGETSDFLATFKSYGWYLDDLVLTPVNHLGRTERMRVCREAEVELAQRIASYKPLAIVSLLKSVHPNVQRAAKLAGSDVECRWVPFAGMGRQKEFFSAMETLVSSLPRLSQ